MFIYIWLSYENIGVVNMFMNETPDLYEVINEVFLKRDDWETSSSFKKHL
jgi:hypothetical protein